MTPQVQAAIIAGAVALLVAISGALNERRLHAERLAADARRLLSKSKSEVDREERRIRADAERQAEQLLTAFRQQEIELRTEFMAEAAINRMLREAKPKRSFEALSRRIGGFDGNDGNDLRQLLVRSGTVRYWTKEAPPREMWGLVELNLSEEEEQDEEEEQES